MAKVKLLGIVVVVSVVTWAVVMTLLSVLARKPGNLGLHAGRLAPCPASPNCVCSQDGDEGHSIAPLSFTDPPDEAWGRLRTILAAWPRTRIVTDVDGYLHVECTSRVFRFVDDLELYLDRDAKVIHVRSASRAGRSDLGVNRQRVESLRREFAP